MALISRALLYIIRKRGKTVLLFLLFLVIATLTLSGAAIYDGTQTAQLNVRQALGGVFTLEQNTADSSKWKSQAVGAYGWQSWYTGAQLTEALADTIMEKVEGIRGYNATASSYVIIADCEGKDLELLESEGDGELSGLLGSYGDFNRTVAAYASTNTAFDSYFAGGYLELAEGRHLTSKDQNGVIISRELAQLNGLQIGDKLMLRMSEFKASMMGIDAAQTEIETEIVGLFHAAAKSSTMLSNWSMDNCVYTTLDVIRHVRPDTSEEGYEKIFFYVKDPAHLEDIIEQAEALPDIDWSDFIVQSDKSNLEAVMEPLTNMSRLTRIMIALALIIGTVILYLILAGRVKERVHESGILLSLGFTKRNIVLQYLIEVLIIASAAFLASVFTGSAVIKTVGGQLLDYTVTGAASDSNSWGINADGNMIASSDDFAPRFDGQGSLTKIELKVEPEAVLILYAAGAVIICLSVTAAALPVLKMKPREILSRIS